MFWARAASRIIVASRPFNGCQLRGKMVANLAIAHHEPGTDPPLVRVAYAYEYVLNTLKYAGTGLAQAMES